MATTTKKAENEFATPKDDRVEVRVPRGRPEEDPNIFISINGVNYLLPKGQTSLVPRCVAEEYYRSLDEIDKFYDALDSREREARESAKAALGY